MSTLAQDLALLEARGLLRVTLEQAKPIVRFKHALTREATYNSILQARRSELHRAAAETLSAVYPQPDLEMVLTMADHWLRASQDVRALEILLPHAQNLIYTGRSTSLMELLTRLGREFLSQTQQRDLDVALADAHVARGEYDAARALYERALTFPSSDAQRAQLLHSLGAAAYHLHHTERAIEYQRASLALASQLGDIRLQARASGGLGLAYWNRGDYPNTRENLLLSRALAMQIGESIELANAEYNLAGMLLDRGDFRAAMEHAEKAAALYETLGHVPLMVRAMQMLGACHYGLQDLPQAAERYRQAIEKSRELHDNVVTALGLGNLAEVYADWNQLDQAVSAYAEAIAQLRATKYDSLLAYDLASLASVQISQAQHVSASASAADEMLARAQANVTEALELAQRIQSQEDEGLARRVLAEWYTARGDWENARASVRQAIELLEPLGRALELERARKLEQAIFTAMADDAVAGSQKEVSQ
jgi:tetratricopeptide (TPR) repeat protein